MPTFNFCTKGVSSPGIIHDRMPDYLLFLGHSCMDELTNERTFDSQATWVIDVLILLTCYLWVFVQPSTGRRPVDWCRN